MGIINAAIVVISAIYQNQQMEDMKKKKQQQEELAKQQAELNKGMKMPVKGEPTDLPIPYGRVLVGGGVVYRKVASSYAYATPNAAATVMSTSGSDRFSSSLSGSKNEYLFTQQAISAAGINLIENIIIDDKNLKGDYTDSNDNIVTAATPGAKLNEPLAGSARFVIYKDGSIADPSMVANDASRSTALFSKVAYASQFFWLNRDDQQYGGEPTVQYLVQGLKVPTIIGSKGARSIGPKVYSKNSVLCLLDYLLNADYGVGISAAKIDLDSFYDAYVIADRIVKTDVLTATEATKLGFATPGIGAVPTSREVRLYECNLTLDSGKPVRENLTTILETIPDAILIWSGGKYKLRVDYPLVYTAGTYAASTKVQHNNMLYVSNKSTSGVPGASPDWSPAVDAYITDNDIVRDTSSSISWPNAQTRLNFATVKFDNETKNFKTDKACWPPKTGAVYSTYLAEDSGVKLETEQTFTGCNNYYAALARAEYMVRSSRASVTYELTLTSDHFAVEPGDILHLSSEVYGIPGDLIRVTSVTPGEDATLAISAYRFDANVLAWNVADTEVSVTRKLFGNDLGKASGLVFVNNPTSSFNSAGKLTWNNPSDNQVVEYVVKYSTGAVNSSTQWVELGKVSRGTGTQTSFELPVMIPTSFNLAVVSSNLKSYTKQDDYPYIAVTVGLTTGTIEAVKIAIYTRSASLPSTPSGGIYNFASKSLMGATAGWSTTQPTGANDLYVSYAIASTDGTVSSTSSLSWSTPEKISGGTLTLYADKAVLGVSQKENLTLDYNSATGQLTVMENTTDVTSTATLSVSDMLDCTAVINTVAPNKGKFYVTNLVGREGSFKVNATKSGFTSSKTIYVRLAGDAYIRDTTVPPSNPVTVSTSYTSNSLFISFSGTPAYSQGRGHSYTQVWSSVTNNSGVAIKIDEFSGNFYSMPVEPGKTVFYWLKFVSKDGVASNFLAISGATGITPSKITKTNISDGAIETPQLAAGAVTAEKCVAGLIQADSALIANGAITNAKIGDTIQSENYSAGIDGWKIDKQGNIELNSAIFRGTLNIVGAGSDRLELRNNVIKVFQGNVLRVKIGDLSA